MKNPAEGVALGGVSFSWGQAPWIKEPDPVLISDWDRHPSKSFGEPVPMPLAYLLEIHVQLGIGPDLIRP